MPRPGTGRGRRDEGDVDEETDETDENNGLMSGPSNLPMEPERRGGLLKRKFETPDPVPDPAPDPDLPLRHIPQCGLVRPKALTALSERAPAPSRLL